MRPAAILHPVKLWRFYKRAARMKHNDPACYRAIYQPQLCCIGKCIVGWLTRD